MKHKKGPRKRAVKTNIAAKRLDFENPNFTICYLQPIFLVFDICYGKLTNTTFWLYLAMSHLEFYERVKRLTKIKKTTIAYIAGEAGLSLGSYNSYRTKGHLPRADEAAVIAKLLGTTVEYLVTGKNPEPVAAKTLHELQTVLNAYWSGNEKPAKNSRSSEDR